MKRICVSRRGICLTCRQAVEVGADVFVEDKVGLWHASCPEPEKLQACIQARDRLNKRRLIDRLKKQKRALRQQLEQVERERLEAENAQLREDLARSRGPHPAEVRKGT